MKAKVSVAAFAVLTASSPVGPNSRQAPEPCAELSTLASNSNSTGFLPPDLTLECLRSVPLVEGNALQLVGLRAFVQFQSDLDYLRDPPPGHIYPAVDITAGLDALERNLEDGFYDNEYDFQLDIFKLFSSAYDGHLSYVPDIVGVFSFDRLGSTDTDDAERDWFSLFSVSSNGTALPDVYAYSDRFVLTGENASDHNASSITQIDGEDVEPWLNSYASQNGILSDPDANYNYIFRNVPGMIATGSRGDLFATSRYYQGNRTSLTFANGTERDTVNVARILVNQTLDGVSDGASFFQRFCNISLTEKLQQAVQPNSTTTKTEEAAPTQVSYEAIPTDNDMVPRFSAYPSPIAAMSDGSVAGYLPDDDDDLAVLAIPSFYTLPRDAVEFQNVVRQTLATANANNRTRLVIDLRGNSGGAIFQPYDLFRQLFPLRTPYGAGNYRTHELFDFTGRTISESADRMEGLQGTQGTADVGIALVPFNVREDLTSSNESFNSWDEVMDGPNNVTSLVRFNLSDVALTNFPVYGYGQDTAPQPQTFEDENIILLQDGTCASACSIFSEFMKSQAGARSIVVGGRRQIGPMQGVGGTKGSQVQSMLLLYSLVAGAAELAPLEDQFALLSAQNGNLLDGATMALSRASSILEASVNFRNDIRQDDESVTPLQFVYEAANCRFFYTAEMYARQELIWRYAYNWAWGEGAECVPGSMGEDSSNAGTEYFDSQPPETATNFFGGNRTVFPTDSLGSGLGNGTSSSGGGQESSEPDPANGSDRGSGESDEEESNTSAAKGLSVPLIFATLLAAASGALLLC